MVTLFAALSALAYGCADFTGGLASRRSPVSAVVAWSQAVGIVVALIAVPFLGGTAPTLNAWLWGAAAGLCGAAGLGFLYQGLATGLASVVSPTAALVGAALPVFFGVVTGERPDTITWIGVAAALPAILLLTFEKGERKGAVLKSVRTGLAAGLGFGGFFILLSRSGSESGIWPLVAARSASVPLLLILTMIRRKPLSLAKGSLGTTLWAGVLDMSANVFYLLAARSGMLITAVVITALYPAPTVLLQRFVLKERLGILRLAGLALALAGIALIGLG
jgi:drug/metabolite transporter (DMT)-like permease